MKRLDIQARCDRVPFFRHLGFSVTEVNDMQILAIMPFEQRSRVMARVRTSGLRRPE
jgi:acyl-coenzyme A thioesterase PaaI-like protein